MACAGNKDGFPGDFVLDKMGAEAYNITHQGNEETSSLPDAHLQRASGRCEEAVRANR